MARVVPLVLEALELLPNDEMASRVALLRVLTLNPEARRYVDDSDRNRWLDELRTLLQVVDDEPTRTRLEVFGATELIEQGDFETAFERAEALLERASRPAVVGAGLNASWMTAAVGRAAVAATALGNLEVAERFTKQQVESGARLGLANLVSNLSAALAALQLLRYRMPEYDAVAALEYVPTYLWNRMRMHAAAIRGNVTDAIQLLPETGQAQNVTLHTQLTADRVLTLWRAGQVALAQDEWLNVEPSIPQLTVYQGAGVVAYLDEAGPLVGGSLLGDWVREHLLAGADGWSSWRVGYASPACAARVLAGWAAALGDFAEAEQRYRDALEWCRREGAPIEEGRCLQGLAELAERAGRIEGARTHLDAAGEIFARTGTKFFLDQVIAKKGILRA